MGFLSDAQLRIATDPGINAMPTKKPELSPGPDVFVIKNTLY